MATKVTTKQRTAPAGAPKLGKNAMFYAETILPKNVGGKRKANEVVKRATTIAQQRSDRLVRIEYLFVAEGRASEREFGSPKMEKMRREVVGLRVPRKSRVKAKPAVQPRKRVSTRKRVTATSKTATKRSSTRKTSAATKTRSSGKGSGSGRARGRASTKSKK